MEVSLTERLAGALSGSLASGNLWLALVAAGVGGLLTAFTPCVYPLIPVTVRYFGAMQGARRASVLRLAFVYVLGMSLLYAALGMTAASLKLVFGSFLGSAWVLGAVAALCVAMGLSMLGLFSIQLPSGLNTRLSQVGDHTTFGAFGMGLVSGLIAAPCTGPVLAVILTLVASTGAASLGLVLMLAFSFGLGLPFLILAVSSSALQRVPSGGPWMELIKFVLATAMFVVAVYFLKLGWPSVGAALQSFTYATWLGWALVAAALAFVSWYLALLTQGGGRALKPISVTLLTVGMVFVLLGGPTSQASTGAPSITWVTSHDDGLARARSRRAPVLIDFTADWCLACKELDRETYSDARVVADAKRFVALKIDATETTDEIDRLFALYNIRGLPSVIFIGADGRVLSEPRVTGFVPPERFLALMQQVR